MMEMKMKAVINHAIYKFREVDNQHNYKPCPDYQHLNIRDIHLIRKLPLEDRLSIALNIAKDTGNTPAIKANLKRTMNMHIAFMDSVKTKYREARIHLGNLRDIRDTVYGLIGIGLDNEARMLAKRLLSANINTPNHQGWCPEGDKAFPINERLAVAVDAGLTHDEFIEACKAQSHQTESLLRSYQPRIHGEHDFHRDEHADARPINELLTEAYGIGPEDLLSEDFDCSRPPSFCWFK